MVKPNISFVVPLLNHLALTQEMVATLAASMPAGLGYEVILVDDREVMDCRGLKASQ